MAEIRITLCSDICIASGSGYAHTIDTDICYDRYGLPFFPSRRLKGCLREAAMYICPDAQETINAVFGKTGSGTGGALSISNGRLEDYPDLVKEMESFPKDQKPSQEQILALFTKVRGQTSLENGVAKKETLRYTRVLNQYLPYLRDGKQASCTFVFPVSCDAAYDEFMSVVCKALRHIGFNRNRGLGAVSCEYRAGGDEKQNRVSLRKTGEETAAIDLRVTLLDPMILSDGIEDCLQYIPGSALLGALAGLYLKNRCADEQFSALFLEDKVRYGNLYYEDACGNHCIPAPAWLRKMKVGHRDEVVCEDGVELADGAYTHQFVKNKRGEAKPLKNAFVAENAADGSICPAEIGRETVYHHVRNGDRMLYTQTSLCAGQTFSGTISGPLPLMEELEKLLNQYPLRIGKSRTAQYAGCFVSSGKASEGVDGPVRIRKGDTVVFDLVSDVILTDENGINTVSSSALLKALLQGCGCSVSDPENVEFTLGYKQIGGYNAKRNLQNLPVNALAMGSTVILTSDEDAEIPAEFFIGERICEGFGRIRCRTADQIMNIKILSAPAAPAEAPAGSLNTRLTGLFTAQDEKREAIRKGIELGSGRGSDKDLTKSFIGRAILMCEQAKDRDDLKRRIDSIKNESKREKLTKLYEEAGNGREWRLRLITALQLMKYTAREGGTDE